LCTLAHFNADVEAALTQKEGNVVLETTDIHRRMKTLDLLIDANKDNSLSDVLERTKLGIKKRAEADAKKMPLHYFADTWNILRFVKGN
jgi:isocitrate dehydrogenase kinase/phosphatase